MHVLYIFFLFSLLGQGVAAGKFTKKQDATERANGGRDAPEGRFPYMCAIYSGSQQDFQCGGILIHPKWVVTAAHCVEIGAKAHNGIVHCGAYDNITTLNIKNATTISNLYIHEKYRSIEEGFDIALIELRDPFDLPTPQLNFDIYCGFKTGRSFWAMGWGHSRDRALPSERLEMVDKLKYIRRPKCRQFYEKGVVANHHICAEGTWSPTGIKDTCRGDSGGPLAILDTIKGNVEKGVPKNDIIVGVVSFGPELCGNGDAPGGYVSIQHFAKWIEETAGEDICMNHGHCEGDAYVRPQSCIRKRLEEKYAKISQKERMRVMAAAIESDDVMVVGVLLGMGFNSSGLYHGSSYVRKAVSNNATESLKAFLDAGADVDRAEEEDGSTALHLASFLGYVKIVKLLIQYEANPNAKDALNYIPLHHACLRGFLDIVKELVGVGSNVNAQTDILWTPLHYAVLHGYHRVVGFLLKSKANPSIKNDVGMTASDVVCTEGCSQKSKQKTFDLLP